MSAAIAGERLGDVTGIRSRVLHRGSCCRVDREVRQEVFSAVPARKNLLRLTRRIGDTRMTGRTAERLVSRFGNTTKRQAVLPAALSNWSRTVYSPRCALEVSAVTVQQHGALMWTRPRLSRVHPGHGETGNLRIALERPS